MTILTKFGKRTPSFLIFLIKFYLPHQKNVRVQALHSDFQGITFQWSCFFSWSANLMGRVRLLLLQLQRSSSPQYFLFLQELILLQRASFFTRNIKKNLIKILFFLVHIVNKKKIFYFTFYKVIFVVMQISYFQQEIKYTNNCWNINNQLLSVSVVLLIEIGHVLNKVLSTLLVFCEASRIYKGKKFKIIYFRNTF